MSEAANSTSPSQLPVQDKQRVETLAEVIKEKAPDVLAAIPADKRAALARVTIEKHEISMRSSPLPDAQELEAYNKIIPDGANRILIMTEKQSAHRIEIEAKVITSQQSQAFFGQVCALVITLTGLLLATYAAVSGQPVFGSVIGGTTLASIVSAFLYTKHSQKKDLGQKNPQVQPPQMPPQFFGQGKKNKQRKK